MATIISQSISDEDMTLLKRQIWDEDNEDNPADLWLKSALSGKVNSVWGKFQEYWMPKLLNDSSVANISGSKSEFINQVTTRSDYKTRYTLMSGSFQP